MAGKDPHGPNRYSNYFNVHDKVMRAFENRGFVLSNDLALAAYGNGYLLMEGSVSCLGEIELTVHKIIQVLPQPKGEPMVQTVDYSYNARVRGLGNILRYDFPHPDHNRFHHVHRYNAFAENEQETIDECVWPTLGQVLDELERWYYRNREQLPATEYP